MHFLIRLIVNAVALIIVAYLFQGHGVIVTSFIGAVVAAFVLGIANAILRPILIILTLPIQIVTLGLFTFVINAVLFYVVGQVGAAVDAADDDVRAAAAQFVHAEQHAVGRRARTREAA